jgi:hypothetical protein
MEYGYEWLDWEMGDLTLYSPWEMGDLTLYSPVFPCDPVFP